MWGDFGRGSFLESESALCLGGSCSFGLRTLLSLSLFSIYTLSFRKGQKKPLSLAISELPHDPAVFGTGVFADPTRGDFPPFLDFEGFSIFGDPSDFGIQ